MKCPEIREHLSAFLDGMLDAEKTAYLEEHLKSCPDCSVELKELKNLAEVLGSMDTLSAPQGFENEVHQRIAHHGSFSKILRTLFSPFHIKIPIQVASVVTACLIAVFIYHNMRTERMGATLDAQPEIRTGAEKPVPNFPASSETKTEGIPHSTLLQAAPARKKMKSTPFQLELVIPSNGRPASSEKGVAQIAGEQKTSPLRESSRPKDAENIVRDETLSKKRVPVDALMDNLIRESGGRILRADQDKFAGKPLQFSVEIPAQKLSFFVKKLASWGSLDPPPPKIPFPAEKSVHLRIKILCAP